MLRAFKSDHQPTRFADHKEITLGALLNFLDVHPAQPLLFVRDGRPVKPGYHVTEVKAGRFAALDCGANPESWTEVIVQLWDTGETAARPMATGKFGAIIRTVADRIGLDLSARLTFEVSDGVEPLQLYRAGAPQLVADAVQVELTPRLASCKPRDRWLRERNHAAVSGCCGIFSQQPCCG